MLYLLYRSKALVDDPSTQEVFYLAERNLGAELLEDGVVLAGLHGAFDRVEGDAYLLEGIDVGEFGEVGGIVIMVLWILAKIYFGYIVN